MNALWEQLESPVNLRLRPQSPTASKRKPYITLEPRIGGFFVLFNRPEHIAHQYVEKHLTLKKFEDFLPRPHFTISMINCHNTEQFVSKRKLIATDLRPCMFQHRPVDPMYQTQCMESEVSGDEAP